VVRRELRFLYRTGHILPGTSGAVMALHYPVVTFETAGIRAALGLIDITFDWKNSCSLAVKVKLLPQSGTLDGLILKCHG